MDKETQKLLEMVNRIIKYNKLGLKCSAGIIPEKKDVFYEKVLKASTEMLEFAVETISESIERQLEEMEREFGGKNDEIDF